MPNTIKYSTDVVTRALRKGNYYLGVGDEGKGPTNETGFWNGFPVGTFSYVIYQNKESNGPSIYPIQNDAELIERTNQIDTSVVRTTKEECFSYFAGQSDKMIVNKDYDSVSTDGLVLNFDTSFLGSYPFTGSLVYDISSNNNHSTFANGQLWTEKGSEYGGSFSGSIDFDGTNQVINFTASNLGSVATVEMWCKIGSGYSGKMFMGWNYYDIYCVGGRIGFNTGNGDLYGISQATVNSLGIVDEWTHYVFEFRSDVSYTNNKIYINGSLQTLSQQLGSESSGNRNFSSGSGRIASWRSQVEYVMPMRMSIFRVYNRSLSQSEVTTNYNNQKGRYQNFFRNGNFKFLDTSQRLINYTSGSVSTTTVLEGYNYALRMPQVFRSGFLGDGFQEVDTSKTFRFSASNRTLLKGGAGDNILSGGHLGFACYDRNFTFIDLRNCGGIANTQLTRDLVAGDSYAYVSNQNNQWNAANSLFYFRHFCLYPPTHPVYNEGWKYTRIGFGDVNIYYNEITDIGGGELRLRFADSSGNWVTFPNIGYPTPTGTRVMNGVAGGTYNYVFYPAQGAFGTWSTWISSPFTGENRNSSVPFRFATKYVKFMHLINYSVASGTTPLPVMLFGQVTLEQLN